MCVYSSSNVGEVKEAKATSVSQNEVELVWKKVGSAQGYNIYQKTNDSYKKVASVEKGDEQKYIIDNLNSCTKYDFCIKGYKNFGKKTYESKKAEDIKVCTAPAQQSLSVKAQGEKKVDVSLQAVDGASGYEIEYATKNDFSDASKENLDSSDKNKVEIKDLKADTEYFFKARTYVDFNDNRLYGDWSKTVKEKVYDKQTTEIDPTKPMIAITFDDGPSYNGASGKILDTIEKYGVKATFFMVGTNAKANPDNVKRKVKLGCQIGNHTYDHANYGNKVSASSIKKGRDAIESVSGGAKVTCFRSTGGNTTSSIRAECKKEGVPLYYWSLDTLDWKYRDADRVYKTVMKNVKDGDIILMHEIYDSSAEAFEKLVPALLSKGYQLVTCDELVRAKTGKEPVAGQQYMSATEILNNTK